MVTPFSYSFSLISSYECGMRVPSHPSSFVYWFSLLSPCYMPYISTIIFHSPRYADYHLTGFYIQNFFSNFRIFRTSDFSNNPKPSNFWKFEPSNFWIIVAPYFFILWNLWIFEHLNEYSISFDSVKTLILLPCSAGLSVKILAVENTKREKSRCAAIPLLQILFTNRWSVK